jgi:hypothetical protein
VSVLWFRLVQMSGYHCRRAVGFRLIALFSENLAAKILHNGTAPPGLFAWMCRMSSRGGGRPWLYSATAMRLKNGKPKTHPPRSPIKLDAIEPVSGSDPENLVEDSATQVADGTPDDLGQVWKALPLMASQREDYRSLSRRAVRSSLSKVRAE